MFKKPRAVPIQAHGAETTEEIIGVLIAISVVSKRMAQKLALLEQTPARKKGVQRYGRRKWLPPDAG